MEINFTIHGIPTAKGRPKFFRRGSFVGTYTPDKTRAAENSVLAQALPTKPEKPLSGPISIEITFHMAIPKSYSMKKKEDVELMPHTNKPDVDNLIKAILDPLNTIYWEDDSQIFKVSAMKIYGKVPRTVVRIHEVQGGN